MNSFDAELAGFPYGDGQYTGEVIMDEHGTWYRIEDDTDGDYEVRERPDAITLYAHHMTALKRFLKSTMPSCTMVSLLRQ
jgi:hypothetical protein